MNTPLIVAKGIPSIEKQHALTQEEKSRTMKQIETLSSEGLEEKEKELVKAIEENEVGVKYSIINIRKFFYMINILYTHLRYISGFLFSYYFILLRNPYLTNC